MLRLCRAQLAFPVMSTRVRPTPRRSSIGVLFAVAALVLSSCGTDRPTVEEWQPNWDRIAAAIPAESMISEDPSGAVCGEALAFLRSNRAELFPTPDLAIDDTVADWVEIAEDTFFECPPNNEQVGSFSQAYGELLRLQGEIELVLDMDRGS